MVTNPCEADSERRSPFSTSNELIVRPISAEELMTTNILYNPSIWGPYFSKFNSRTKYRDQGTNNPENPDHHHHNSMKYESLITIPPLNQIIVGNNDDNNHNNNESGIITTSSKPKRGRKDDGRIHSLPNSKVGHYTCPRCMQEFDRSQTFAAHVRAKHYKHESKAEKNQKGLDKKTKQKKLPSTSSSRAKGRKGKKSEPIIGTDENQALVIKEQVEDVIPLLPPPGNEAEENLEANEEN